MALENALRKLVEAKEEVPGEIVTAEKQTERRRSETETIVYGFYGTPYRVVTDSATGEVLYDERPWQMREGVS